MAGGSPAARRRGRRPRAEGRAVDGTGQPGRRTRGAAHADRFVRDAAGQRPAPGAAALRAGRRAWRIAGCRPGSAGQRRRAVLRDGGADAQQGGGGRRAELPVHPFRGALRRRADTVDPRRGLAVPRRPAVRRTHPPVAQDPAQEERQRHLRHPVAGRHQGLQHRCGDYRELRQPHLPAQPAGGRATDPRHLPRLRPQRPTDRDRRPGHAQA
ncbi:hypothetical protein D9M71_596970 [compost metagenome]